MLKEIKLLNILYCINILICIIFFTIYFWFNGPKWLFNIDSSAINPQNWKYILLLTLFIIFLISLLSYLIYSSYFFIKSFYKENLKKYKLWVRIIMFITYVFLPPILLIFSIDSIDNYFINLNTSPKVRENKNINKIIFGLAIATLIPLQIFTYTIPFIFQKSIEKPKKPYFELTNTGKNVIVIYLDGVSGFSFNRMMSENPKYRTALDGFTTYVKAITLGSKTSTSNPSMIGGFEFSPKYWETSLVTQERFFHNAFEKHIKMLKSNDYHNISFNSMSYYGYKNIINPNWWHGNIQQFREDFKKYNVKSLSNSSLYPQYIENIPDAYVLKDLSKIIDINSKNENYYNWSFFQNTHANFTFGDPIVEHKNLNVKNYHKVINWSVDQLINFFNYLKYNNAYDNSMIVLFSDHGERFFGNNGPNVNPNDIQLSIMMAIKPFNKRNNLIFDTEKFITNADLIQIINKSIGNNYNLELDKFNKFGYLSNPLIDDTSLRELFFRITSDWQYYPDKIGQNAGTYRSIFNNWLPI